mmetsp:Transcript_14023/g.38529  ORF Transcript_14023/g.38529 Transcript_14023/m.38529 type:complete len:205 (-) Transcript_14023:508-1122(-)
MLDDGGLGVEEFMSRGCDGELALRLAEVEKDGLEEVLVVIVDEDVGELCGGVFVPLVEDGLRGGVMQVPQGDTSVDIPGVRNIPLPNSLRHERLVGWHEIGDVDIEIHDHGIRVEDEEVVVGCISGECGFQQRNLIEGGTGAWCKVTVVGIDVTFILSYGLLRCRGGWIGIVQTMPQQGRALQADVVVSPELRVCLVDRRDSIE